MLGSLKLTIAPLSPTAAVTTMSSTQSISSTKGVSITTTSKVQISKFPHWSTAS